MCALTAGADRVRCAPFALQPARDEWKWGSGVEVGAQTVDWVDTGALPGEAFGKMSVGPCQRGFSGSSERSGASGKLFEAAQHKVRAAVGSRLAAIVCVGETSQERAVEESAQVVGRRLGAALAGVGGAGLGVRDRQ